MQRCLDILELLTLGHLEGATQELEHPQEGATQEQGHLEVVTQEQELLLEPLEGATQEHLLLATREPQEVDTKGPEHHLELL